MQFELPGAGVVPYILLETLMPTQWAAPLRRAGGMWVDAKDFGFL